VVSCVPVEGGEDVLILCLNPAPLSTQGCVSLLVCYLRWLLGDRPELLAGFILSHALFFVGSARILEEGGWGVEELSPKFLGRPEF
jgi:hypothetical protein